jgi:hypothetical protein
VPRQFFHSTAEDVVASIEAVAVNGKNTSPAFVAQFIDVPADRAENALKLAVEMRFLSESGGKFSVASPLCDLLLTPKLKQKSAVLRVAVESYEPFTVFRQRLNATEFAHQAAQQTKVALDLDEHRDVIKDTLISLGTYSGALGTGGGGVYASTDGPMENQLLSLAQGCNDIAAAEARIRLQIGEAAGELVSRTEVLLPLANALLKAAAGDSQNAVTLAGNAVESYLVELATRIGGVNLTGATGINAKLDKFSQAGKLPKKLVGMGKYLGNVRNAADHGIDTEIGTTWIIQESTGTEFVFVACSFISAATAKEKAQPHRI